VGRTQEAIAVLERAVDANARLRAAPILARTQLVLAEALESRGAVGDAERARSLRAEAMRARSSLGLPETIDALP
jgi:hypothetical protein